MHICIGQGPFPVGSNAFYVFVKSAEEKHLLHLNNQSKDDYNLID